MKFHDFTEPHRKSGGTWGTRKVPLRNECCCDHANIVGTVVTEPHFIQIAAGWFSMGSDAGQAVEAAGSSRLGRFLCHGGDSDHGRGVRPVSWMPSEACRLRIGAMSTSLIRSNLWWRFHGSTPPPIAHGFPR